MKHLLTVLLLLTTLIEAREYNVVFDLQTDDERVLQNKLIGNVRLLREHYRKQGDTLNVAVVISGDAYRFFIKDLSHSPYKADMLLQKSQAERTRMLEAFAKDATIRVCSIGMKHRKIDPATLYPFVTPAFNRTEALVHFQNDGYAYIAVD